MPEVQEDVCVGLGVGEVGEAFGDLLAEFFAELDDGLYL